MLDKLSVAFLIRLSIVGAVPRLCQISDFIVIHVILSH